MIFKNWAVVSHLLFLCLSFLIPTEAGSVTPSITLTSIALATATGTAASNPRCDLNSTSTSIYVTKANESCIDISLSANVSTSMLADINALGVGCQYLTANQVLCLPEVCDIYLVQANDTCTSILSGFSRKISLPVFRGWNPSINSQCSNLASLEGGYICLSPPGSMSVPTGFPLKAVSSAVVVPTNAVTTSNTDCGYWYTIQDGDTCDDVMTNFGITSRDFYFLNPQLGGNCSDLWEGNSYCVEAVGNIQSYSGYPTTTRSVYTTLASNINLNATATGNLTMSWLIPTTATYPTTTAMYNVTAINLTKNYTLCSQAMTHYNVSLEDGLTSEMLDNTAWMTEYDRVCLLDLSQPLPTQGFNTSISLASSTTSLSSPSTAFYATSTSRIKQLSTEMTPSTTTATESALLSSEGSTTSSSYAVSSSTGLTISPDGTCGNAYGYTCAGSQFGDCCDKWGYCGSTTDYCGSICDPSFGTCESNISTNGLCGSANDDFTCLGSSFGSCCSTYGYCGSTTDYCSASTCDTSYGYCDS